VPPRVSRNQLADGLGLHRLVESIAERRGWPEMQALLDRKPFSR